MLHNSSNKPQEVNMGDKFTTIVGPKKIRYEHKYIPPPIFPGSRPPFWLNGAPLTLPASSYSLYRQEHSPNLFLTAGLGNRLSLTLYSEHLKNPQDLFNLDSLAKPVQRLGVMFLFNLGRNVTLGLGVESQQYSLPNFLPDSRGSARKSGYDLGLQLTWHL